jgi:hypothetical protein
MSEIKVNKISPATGTAITLGDSGDTFTVPSGATFTNSGTATGFGGGKIIQTKVSRIQGAYAQSVSGASPYATHNITTDGSTDWEMSITPTSASNQIWHSIHLGRHYNNTASSYYGSIELLRDGTSEAYTKSSYSYGSNAPDVTWWVPKGVNDYQDHFGTLSVLDKPATTSAVSYKLLYQYHGSSAFTFYLNRSPTASNVRSNTGTISTWLCMEIEAVTGA